MKVSIRKTFMADAISLIDVFRLFYDRKLYIIVGMGIFTIIGFIIAKTSPEEYEAVVEVLGEEGLEGSSSGFDILGLATRTLRQPQVSSGGLGVDMFPKIITTSPFLVELMDEKFKFEGRKKPVSLYEYFLEPQPKHFFSEANDYLKDLPHNLKVLVGLAKAKKKKIPPHVRKTVKGYPDIMPLSPEEKIVMAELSKRITIGNSGRVVILSVKMPDPDVAAKLNTIVISKLIDYVVEYKVGKLRKDLEFVRARKEEAELNYKQAQKQLAVFRDSNQGRTTRLAETTEQLLQFEYSLASGIYNTLSNQLVQSEIQIKKETPLFSRLEPVSIPAGPSEPVAKKIVIFYAGLGAVLGFFFIIGHIVVGFFRESDTDGGSNGSVVLTDQKTQ